MSKSKGYRSDAMAAIHETARDYAAAGLISRQTMREFDETCLTVVHDFTPEEIRALREREEVSQQVFAAYLNVSPVSVSKWENGSKHPSAPTLKLLALVEKKGLHSIA